MKKPGVQYFSSSLSCITCKNDALVYCKTSGVSVSVCLSVYYMDLGARKPVFGVYEYTGADQHAHPRRLINAFVTPILESILSDLAGRLAFAHFLQIAMISFVHFLRFQLRTIFTPLPGAISN